jgi:hypothetical protein
MIAGGNTRPTHAPPANWRWTPDQTFVKNETKYVNGKSLRTRFFMKEEAPWNMKEKYRKKEIK